MNHYLYCLLRSGHARPFYIGATSNPKLRESSHRKRFGPEFSFVIMETLDNPEEAGQLEAELIQWYKGRGVPLENCIDTPCYAPTARATEYRIAARRLHEAEIEKALQARTPYWTAGVRGYHKKGANQLEKAAKQEEKLRQDEGKRRRETYAIECQEAFARSVADGSADRIAREILAANKTRT